MQIETTIQEFLLTGQQAGWSTGTSQTYAWHLERFRLWLAERDLTTTEALTRSILRAWGAGLREHWAPATIKGATNAVRSWLKWLYEEKVLGEDLLGALKIPRVPEKVQRTLSAAEVGRILGACETPVEHGLNAANALTAALRNAALVALLYDSLVRASELCQLRSTDVDLDAGRLIVRVGKGGRSRVALFGPETTVLLRTWLTARPTTTALELFIGIGGNTPGEALTPSGLRLIVRRLGERAGVQGVSPHSFRRGGTAQLTLDNVPTRIVQLIGGWSKINMVEIYTRWLTLQTPEINAVYTCHSPVAAATNGVTHEL